jgi:hypothetical protein
MSTSTWLAFVAGGAVSVWLIWYTRPEKRIFPAGLLADRDSRLARFDAEREERMATYRSAWGAKWAQARLIEAQRATLKIVPGTTATGGRRS